MNDKGFGIVGVIIIIAVVVAGGWWYHKNGGSLPDLYPSSSESPSASPSATAVPPKAGAKNTPKPATAGVMTYTEAVATYGATRIQFDQYCQANPKNAVYKNGTTIMLDNRSGDARTVSVNGKAYNLAGYGFQLVVLSSANLPQTLGINCGSAVNVGQILLQANIGGSY